MEEGDPPHRGEGHEVDADHHRDPRHDAVGQPQGPGEQPRAHHDGTHLNHPIASSEPTACRRGGGWGRPRPATSSDTTATNSTPPAIRAAPATVDWSGPGVDLHVDEPEPGPDQQPDPLARQHRPAAGASLYATWSWSEHR